MSPISFSVRVLGLLAALGWPAGIVGFIAIAFGAYSGLWTLFESIGIPGSSTTFIGLSAVAVVVGAGIVLSLRPLQWILILNSLRRYARTTLTSEIVDQNTVLLGDGPGSAIICAMLVKALQLEGRGAPPMVILDLVYDEGNPIVGDIAKIRMDRVEGRKVLIVLSAISTGRNLSRLREVLGNPDWPVFSYLVEPSAFGRSDFDYFVVKGGRELLPWPRSV